MFNFIRESRVTQGDLHSITLEISEDIYQTFYGDLSEDTAQDILTQYLKYRQDDGRASDKISWAVSSLKSPKNV